MHVMRPREDIVGFKIAGGFLTIPQAEARFGSSLYCIPRPRENGHKLKPVYCMKAQSVKASVRRSAENRAAHREHQKAWAQRNKIQMVRDV